MEYQSTRPITSNVTEFSNDDISNLNLNHSNLHMHLIESFRVVFTLIGMVIGIVGIGFNSALIISSIVKASSRTGLKTRNLIISLGVADICLLVFGMNTLAEHLFSYDLIGFILWLYPIKVYLTTLPQRMIIPGLKGVLDAKCLPISQKCNYILAFPQNIYNEFTLFFLMNLRL